MKSDAIEITLKHECSSQTFKNKSDMKTYDIKNKERPFKI